MVKLTTIEEIKALTELQTSLSLRLNWVSLPLSDLLNSIDIEKLNNNNQEEINKIDKCFLELLICDSLLDSIISVEMDITISINHLRSQLRCISSEQK